MPKDLLLSLVYIHLQLQLLIFSLGLTTFCFYWSSSFSSFSFSCSSLLNYLILSFSLTKASFFSINPTTFDRIMSNNESSIHSHKSHINFSIFIVKQVGLSMIEHPLFFTELAAIRSTELQTRSTLFVICFSQVLVRLPDFKCQTIESDERVIDEH